MRSSGLARGRMPSGYVSYAAFELASQYASNVNAECECPPGITADTPAVSVSFTRASTALCVKANGTGVTCAANQPVIERRGSWYGIRSEGAATNLFTNSNYFLAAGGTWSTANTPTITGGQQSAPSGATTLIVDDSAAQFEGVFQTVTTGLATGYYYTSCWLASGTQTKATVWVTKTGGSPFTRCEFNLTSTPTRYTCVGPNFTTLPADVQVGLYPGIVATDVGGVYFGGCQLERNSVINALGDYNGTTSYIATTSAQVTRAATSMSITVPAAVSNDNGCARVSTYWDSHNALTGTEWIASQLGAQTNDEVVSYGSLITRKAQFYDGTNSPQTAAIGAALKDSWTQGRAGWTTTGGNASEVGGRTGVSSAVLNSAAAYDGAVSVAGLTLRFGSNYAATRYCNCLIGPTMLDSSRQSCPFEEP